MLYNYPLLAIQILTSVFHGGDMASKRASKIENEYNVQNEDYRIKQG